MNGGFPPSADDPGDADEWPQWGSGEQLVEEELGGRLSSAGAAFGKLWCRGSTEDPRCGGRDYAYRQPTATSFGAYPMEQRPSHRPETRSQAEGRVGDPGRAPA